MTKNRLGKKIDARGGGIPESWACIDCGLNTAPGLLNRAQIEQALLLASYKTGGGGAAQQKIDEWSEVYAVKHAVWKAAGEPSGCLCIGCLEKRLGRILTPKDFDRNHPFQAMPGTDRLLSRRDGA